MTFTYKALGIEGPLVIEPRVFGDERGYFFEGYNKRDFAAIGIFDEFVQDNVSCSKKGVLRGLHFQRRHPQAKLVRVNAGKVWDVVVDLRSDSRSFGNYCGIPLSGDTKTMFYIPAGFAHGFYVLSDEAVFSYKCTDYYHPEFEGGILWNDLSIGIDWPLDGATPVVSEKDSKLPFFDPRISYFENRDGES
jgi:dTDP-4-dehydrorhamnose 3,5-epimerase